jgi:hypothetical protein
VSLPLFLLLVVFIFSVFLKDIRLLKCVLLICVVAVQLQTEGHQAAFIIKIGHGATPKLYNTGPKGGNECGCNECYAIFIMCLIFIISMVAKLANLF